jgi:hypothetical protein
LQLLGGTHSVSTVQVWRQELPSQVDGSHEIPTPAMQVPSPSQTLAGTRLSLPAQADSLQIVPAMCLAQPPSPLHMPLWPQVSSESTRQSL